MKLYEVYTSIQGETHYAGRPCTLVRFAGCDLRCGYCDTDYAFTGGQEVTRESIVKDVLARPVRLVLLTGGEPLLQAELPELARDLISAGCEVMVETGGHRDIASLPPETVIILDVKTPGSGESHKMMWQNLERLSRKDAVKFVICSQADYDWSRAIVREHRLESRCEVLFSPSHGVVDPQQLVAWMLRDGLHARLNLQIHKYVWPPDQRGV